MGDISTERVTIGGSPQTFTQSIDGGSTGSFTHEGPVTVYAPGFEPDATAPHDHSPVLAGEATDAATTKVVKTKRKPAAKPAGQPAETK